MFATRNARCGECRKKTVALATVPFSIKRRHDGRKYNVVIPSLTVPRCSACGAISIDSEAGKEIDVAFRKEAGLLAPGEIRNGRIQAGFPNQQEFAKCFGVSSSTVSRWENGSQVQQRFHDGMLRAFFMFPDLRDFLAALHGVRSQTTNVTALSS